MTKLDILCELHAVIGARLFGEGPWLMEREDALKSNKELGNDTRLTSLGKEIDFELLSIFMGRWDYRDVPIVLEERGLITKSETDGIYGRWGRSHNPELAMKG